MPMVITVQCPSCSTVFPVDTAKVPEGGVYARCSECEGVFFVERPAEASVPTAAAIARETAPDAPGHETAPPAESVDVEEAPTSEPWGEWSDEPEAAAADSHADRPAEETFAIAPAGEEAPDASPWSEDAPEAAPWSDEPTEAGASHEAEAEGSTELPPLEPAVELEVQDAVGDGLARDASPESAAGTWPGEAAPAPAPDEPPVAMPAPPAFTFGRRDPHEKARRLARVLVSDMIMYNPERHTRAIETRALKEDFADEIRKSWQEYLDQVGEDIANNTTYFDDALNDILARGERVFP